MKDLIFDFDTKCLDAFCRLKKEFISEPIIQLSNWRIQFECNASDYAVERIDISLMTHHQDEKKRVELATLN